MEFEHREKKPDWLWSVGLIGVLASGISFFYGNIFFGIFIIVASVVTIIYALKHPKELTITISSLGIQINNSLIPYKDITSFWLDETGKEDKLLLLTKTSFVPILSFPLSGIKAETVRNALTGNVEEKELRESRSIALFDKLGF